MGVVNYCLENTLMDTSKIKMVVFDIDGTLIAERENKIQASAVTAIHALHDK